MLTVRDVIRWATKEQGLPVQEAQALLQQVLHCPRLHLMTEPARPLRPIQWDRFRQGVDARCRGTPLAYVLGEVPFLDLTLAVGPGALIPRPETEGLVRMTRDRARQLGEVGKLADIGCGCGAIGLALAVALPGWRVFLADRSAEACSLARKNARRLGLHRPRVVVRGGDLLQPLGGQEPFDLLVSNPPYIPSDQLQGLLPGDIRYHEPRRALDGGPDGLDFYRRLAREAPPFLRPGGYLVLEIGHDQGAAVRQLLEEAGNWHKIQVLSDLAGTDRVVVAQVGRSLPCLDW